MKKKIKLISIGNQDKFNYYSFKKCKEFFEIMAPVFNEALEIHFDLNIEYENKKGELVVKKRKISDYKDDHEIFTNGKIGSRLDIFYGDKVIFITLNASNKIRLKFNELLEKVTYMSKPVDLKKRKKAKK